MDRLVTLRLDITQLTLPTLSFCLPTAEKIKEWADELPIANRNETARQLYHALHDLNHLICDASTRYSLLEVIYPLTLQVTHALTKSFLSKNVSLNEQQRKIANITQSIYANITSAYRLVVQQYLHDKKSNDKKYMAEAIYRSLQCASYSLLCSQQLYVSSPDMFWLQFNDLFSLAEKLKLSTNRVMLADATALDLPTIRSVYITTLLFYTCKPAQLRQSEQSAVYKALPNWAHFAALHSPAKQDDLFVIRLDKNTPPIYKSFFEGIKDEDSAGLDIADLVKGFNASGLVNELKQKNTYKSDEKIKSKDSVELVLPPDIDHALLTHLVTTWGVMAIRVGDRKVIKGDIELCVGLTATHYYVSGNVSFEKQMQAGKKSALVEKENNRFKEGNSSRLGAALDDSWLDSKLIPNNPAYSIDIDDLAAGLDEDEQSTKNEGYTTYLASVINISDSGCCLQFASPPPNLHSGEIIGIRSQTNWRIGAIRWLRHVKNKGIQIGVEFLGSQVLPCGAKLLHKTGDTSDYMRTLLLSTNDLSTLITPRRPFKEGSKAYLKIGESERRVNLSPLIAATGGFCQFKFNYINELPK